MKALLFVILILIIALAIAVIKFAFKAVFSRLDCCLVAVKIAQIIAKIAAIDLII